MDSHASMQTEFSLEKPSSESDFQHSARVGGATIPEVKVAALTSAQVDTLLDKLIYDDEYRALLLREPAAAMKQIGAPPELALCFAKCNQLADPQTLRNSRSAIQKQIGGPIDAHIHDLRVS